MLSASAIKHFLTINSL